MNLYTIYDEKVRLSSPLIECVNDEAAIRIVSDNLAIIPHVESLVLYCVGFFDTKTCVLSRIKRRTVCTVADIPAPVVVLGDNDYESEKFEA